MTNDKQLNQLDNASQEKIIYEHLKNSSMIAATHGEATAVFHERPFRLDADGQTIVGSIDLVWQTKDGDILVDFKTCPMGEAVLNPESTIERDVEGIAHPGVVSDAVHLVDMLECRV